MRVAHLARPCASGNPEIPDSMLPLSRSGAWQFPTRPNPSSEGRRRPHHAELHMLPAVDMNLRAVDVGARLRAQHIDDLGDFIGRAQPVHGDLLLYDLFRARR